VMRCSITGVAVMQAGWCRTSIRSVVDPFCSFVSARLNSIARRKFVTLSLRISSSAYCANKLPDRCRIRIGRIGLESSLSNVRPSREPPIDNGNPIRLLTPEIVPPLCSINFDFDYNANDAILFNCPARCKRWLEECEVHSTADEAAVDDALISAFLMNS
jgi:hypothetical protein